MQYEFEFIEKYNYYDSVVYVLKYEKFLYHTFCLNNIIQFVDGEKPESYLNWEIPPSEYEIEIHDTLEETFNNDHSIIQPFIDTLI